MRAYDLTVTGSLTVSGSTTLTGDITYDDLTATGNIVTTGANKVISGSSTSTGSFGEIYVANDDNTPAILFRRGTISDSSTDWKIQDAGGNLKFAQRGTNAVFVDNWFMKGSSA